MKGKDFEEELRMHPCFSDNHEMKYGRIHLPVAPACNIKCKFCGSKIGRDQDVCRPGMAKSVISPREALQLVSKHIQEKWFKVVGISGPGEPLCNEPTFAAIELIKNTYPELKICLCSNGLLLEKSLQRLLDLGIGSLSITINALNPEIGALIYSYVIENGEALTGLPAAERLITNQLNGLQKAAEAGLPVKINTIVIPGINETEITKIAREVKARGAFKQNIVPLIPMSKFNRHRRPSAFEIQTYQTECEKLIPQFKTCKQCRADAIGIPGMEKPCNAG